jgi:hypothetical protein
MNRRRFCENFGGRFVGILFVISNKDAATTVSLFKSGGYIMKYERVLLFAAGAAVGVGAVCFVRSKAGKKAAVAIVGKGLKLRNCVVSAAERVKETFEDVMAEAKYVNGQKTDAD